MNEEKIGSVRIFDTTLRDGEQTPGVSLTPEDKLQIARQLDRLGVDTIEAGFPITSEGEKAAVKLIAKEGLSSEICALARTDKRDIDAALACDVSALHVFIASSDIHLQHKLMMTREEARERAVEFVEYAKSHGVTVEFSAEDATRSDRQYVLSVFKSVMDAGADRLDIPDTVGYTTPERMQDLTSEVVQLGDRVVSCHCHNDFGLATANSLASIRGGARQAQCTINGIGERGGNASLEEVVMSLHSLYGVTTNINTKLIYETSQLVSRLTGVSVQPNKAIVGDNAFVHESGIHTHGVIKLPFTYEPIDPEIVGRKRGFQAGKHAGGHGIQAQLDDLGIAVNPDQLKTVVQRVKELGDKGKGVTEMDLAAIARAIVGESAAEEKVLDLVDLTVVTGNRVVPTASVKLIVDGKTYVAAETGMGPVDSAVKAIQKITDNIANIRLSEYRLRAITGGSDALAEVLIKVEDRDGYMASATAAGEDIVVASVNALIQGINKILIRRKQKPEPTPSSTST